jgi:hypothetical protein
VPFCAIKQGITAMGADAPNARATLASFAQHDRIFMKIAP